MQIAFLLSLYLARPVSSLVCWLNGNRGNCLALGVQCPHPACRAPIVSPLSFMQAQYLYQTHWENGCLKALEGCHCNKYLRKSTQAGRTKVGLGLTHFELQRQLASLPLGLGKESDPASECMVEQSQFLRARNLQRKKGNRGVTILDEDLNSHGRPHLVTFSASSEWGLSLPEALFCNSSSTRWGPAPARAVSVCHRLCSEASLQLALVSKPRLYSPGNK